MKGMIVLSNGATESRVNEVVQAFRNEAEIAVVSTSESVSSYEGAKLFVSDNSLSEGFQAAVASIPDSEIILVDAAAEISIAVLREAANAALGEVNALGMYSFASKTEEVSSINLSAAEVVHMLNTNIKLPLPILLVRKSFVFELGLVDTRSNSAFLSSMLVAALAEAESIDTEVAQLELSQEALDGKGFTLTATDAAVNLRLAINSINIEELFPNRPWEHDQSENAAACYNILATQFIHLGDYQSAADALGLSEQLEETPRTLALRGIIALLQGQALEAVANMVSSLQEYERYKKGTEHKLIEVNPSPENLQVINTTLQSGLEALNQRKNEEAAGRFAKALFLFDKFYSDHGLSSTIS